VLFGLEFLCIYAALPLTAASRVSVFIYLAPFVVALALPWFQPAEKLSPLQSAGLVGAFLALAYAFQEGFTSAAPAQWRGDALAVLAACMWGATTLVVRTTRLATAAPEKTLFYQLTVSALLLAVMAFARGERWPAGGLPAWAWLSVAYQSVVIAFASYLAWFWLLHRYPAMRLSAFSFLTPLFGLVFAAWVLGESIGTRLVVAMAFIAIGIALVNRKPAPAETLARELP
jgi:drug/metabolite transporter (DMT)-like permease